MAPKKLCLAQNKDADALLARNPMALLMGMPPVIVTVMLVLNPAFIQPLFADPIGHTLLVAGIALQTIGYFVIRKIIKIQV